MSLLELKLSVLENRHQIVTLDPNGIITASCNTLVDLAPMVGSNAFECIAAFQCLGPAVAALTPEDAELRLPMMSASEFGDDLHHDVTFRFQGEGKLVLLLISEHTVAQESRREIQQERNEAAMSRDRALEQNGSLRKYAHVVTHDLKAPLRAVGHLVDWIEESMAAGEDELVIKYLNLLRDRTQKMESLMEGILGYSLSSDQREQTKDVDTRSLVQELVGHMDADGKVTFTIDDHLPVIQGIPSAVRQAFSNLISNAVEHGRSNGGAVSISAEVEADAYTFRVSDNGPGIDPSQHDSIFRAFTSLHTSGGKNGTGLGLHIVQQVVEGAGGSVDVESEHGRGTTFLVRWPRVPAQAEAPE